MILVIKETCEMKYMIDGIEITSNEELKKEELNAYVQHVRKQNPGKLIEDIQLEFVGEDVNIGYHLLPEKFEKIRRITGYLVGTVDRFNNGKAAEERDRVKHA